jgi:FMN phosphatase YigB (HAD superfamily)
MEDFMQSLEVALSQPNTDLMAVVERLKSQGLKTGLLTNNWASPEGRSLLLQV